MEYDATGPGLKAGFVQCIKPTGGVCLNVEKIELNQLLGRDFPVPARWRHRMRRPALQPASKNAIIRSNPGSSGECPLRQNGRRFTLLHSICPAGDDVEIIRHRHEIGAGAGINVPFVSARGRLDSRREIEPTFDVGELRRCAYGIQEGIDLQHDKSGVAQPVGGIQPCKCVVAVAPLGVDLGILISAPVAKRLVQAGELGFRLSGVAELVCGDG